MKSLYVLSKKSALFIFSCAFFCGTLSAGNGAYSQVKLVDSTVISAWIGEHPVSSFDSIEAKVGSISSAPSTWTHTVFTDEDHFAVGSPLIAHNANGDVLLIYGYYDNTSSTPFLNAALLPLGETEWVVSTVSDSTNPLNSSDYQAAVDESGNAIVTWTAYNNTAGEEQIMTATANVSAPSTWSGPSQVSE